MTLSISNFGGEAISYSWEGIEGRYLRGHPWNRASLLIWEEWGLGFWTAWCGPMDTGILARRHTGVISLSKCCDRDRSSDDSSPG